MKNIYSQHSETAVAALIFDASFTPTFQQLMDFAKVTASTLLLKIKIDFNYTWCIYFIILNSKHINKLIEGACYFRQPEVTAESLNIGSDSSSQNQISPGIPPLRQRQIWLSPDEAPIGNHCSRKSFRYVTAISKTVYSLPDSARPYRDSSVSFPCSSDHGDGCNALKTKFILKRTEVPKWSK